LILITFNNSVYHLASAIYYLIVYKNVEVSGW